MKEGRGISLVWCTNIKSNQNKELEVMLGQTWFQHGQNMALAWSQEVGTQETYALRPF